MSTLQILVARPTVQWTIFAVVCLIVASVYYGPVLDHPLPPPTETQLWSEQIGLGMGMSDLDLPSRQLILILHVCASLLLSWVCWRTGMPTWPAYLSGLFFLVGVAQFRAVHSLSGFGFVSALIGAMGCCAAMAEYSRSRRWFFVFVAATSQLVAVAAHASALAAVVFCALNAKRNGAADKKSMTTAVAVASFPAILLVAWSLPIVALQVNVGGLLWLLDRLVLTAYWLPLVPLYEAGRWEHAFGVALLVVLFVLTCRTPVVALWAVWTLATVVLVALFVPAASLMTEGPSRFLYLPAAGLAALSASIVAHLARQHRILGLCFLLVVGCGIHHAWSKSHAVSEYVLGKAYRDSGDMTRGAELLDRAVDAGADVIPLFEALVLMCETSAGSGDGPGFALQRALRQFPNEKQILLLELVAHATGPDEEARTSAERQLNSFSGHIDAGSAAQLAKHFHNVGYAHHVRGNLPKAARAYEWALSFEPARVITLKNLGDAYIKSRQFHAATDRLEEAVRLRPADQSIHYTLGNMYLLAERNRDAETAFGNALRLNPTDVEAHRKLAKAIFSQASKQLRNGHRDQARRSYQRGMAVAGTTAAERIGVFDELRQMIANDENATDARMILRTYGREP